MTSKLNIVNIINVFADEHRQVKRFDFEFEEQLNNFGSRDELYPIMFVHPLPDNSTGVLTEFGFRVYCFDLIEADRSNIKYALNNTNLIINDFLRYFDPQSHEFTPYSIESRGQIQPMNNALVDYAVGHYVDVFFQVNNVSLCNIPFENGIPVIAPIEDLEISNILTCKTLQNCSTFIDLETKVDNITDENYYTISSELDGSILNFNRNDGGTYSVDLSTLSGATPPLSDVLTVGNTTTGNDIIMSDGDVIKTDDSLSFLNLRNGADGIVKLTGTEITLDGAVRVANTITSNAIGSTVKLNFADPFGATVNTFSIVTDGGLYGAGSSWIYADQSVGLEYGYTYETNKSMGFGAFDSGIVPGAFNANTISVHNNVSASANSGNNDKVASFVGSRNSTFNTGVVNSVILGGEGLVASENNTVYTQNLDVSQELSVGITFWTFDLTEELSFTRYATEALSITEINNIVGTPTTTILVNSTTYTLGNPIVSGDKIDIIVDEPSVIKLKIEK